MLSSIIESKKYPGYYYIPNFTKYVINDKNECLIEKNGYKLKATIGNAGYLQFILDCDDGHRTSLGIHRIVAMMNIPNDDPAKTFINHKNGNKQDNRIENLEWTTPSENDIHAGARHMSSKARPIIITNIHTNETRAFSTFLECSKFLNCCKDSVADRVHKGPGFVDKNGWQYALAKVDVELAEDEGLLLTDESKKGYSARNLLTGEVRHYNNLDTLCLFFDISKPTMISYFSKRMQPVIGEWWQIKKDSKLQHWLYNVDPYIERYLTTGERPVLVLDVKKEKTDVYPSVSVCSKAIQMTQSNICERALKEKKAPFRDGLIIRYYI